MTIYRISCALLIVALWGGPTPAAQPIDAVDVADKLLATTVTVRISIPKPPSANEPRPDAGGTGTGVDSIFLASGVSLGRGLIVTFCNTPGPARFRVTLPDGEQADAQLRVTDDYSGLRLIEIANQRLRGLELQPESAPAGDSPATVPDELAIGMPVMTAAATGIEKPVVSLGVLGGTERSLGGSGLPPLLLCDVRSTETSSGAAIVNHQAKLIGIVAATSTPTERTGWSYAVPSRYVRRLLSARVDKQQVVLRRQRPTAGLTLGAGAKEGTVRVERVDAGGPAQRAGIRSGDLVLDVEGHKIRSAYQAVDLILKKQPGDQVRLLVEQDRENKSMVLTLGGVLAPQVEPRDPLESTVQVGPQLSVSVVRPNEIEVRRGTPMANSARNEASNAEKTDVASLKAEVESLRRMVAELEKELKQLREQRGERR